MCGVQVLNVKFADQNGRSVDQSPSPSEVSNPGKAKDWLCMKLIQEV